MSKDIRSFFVSKSKPKEKPILKVNLSDDDEIPESPDVQIKSKKKSTKKKRVLSDSSDEEIFSKKSKKPDSISKDKEKSKKTEKSLKEIKAVDMFGSGPIKRTEPLVKSNGNKKTETGIHDDDDFEKSLLEIDNIEELAKNANKEKEIILTVGQRETSPHKSKTNGDTQYPCPDDAADSAKNESGSKETNTTQDDKSLKRTGYKIPKRVPTEDKPKSSSSDKKPSSHKDRSLSHRDRKSSPHRKLSPRSEKRSPNKDKKSHHDNGDVKTEDKMRNDKKRDFSEFLEGDTKETREDSSHKKKKLDKSLNSSVLSDEERHERKRHSAALYQSYLNRSGPKNLGAKEMPQGAPGCLRECSFLLTGVLPSFERDAVAECVARCGGQIKSGISRKVTHVLAGDDAGPAKLAKAKDMGIKIIDEDEFLRMIVERSKNNSEPGNRSDTTPAKPEKKKDKEDTKSEKKRVKEDAKPEKRRDKEDAKPGKRRDNEDAKPEKRRDKEDAKDEKRRDSTEAKAEKSKDKQEKTDKAEAKIKSEKVSPDAIKSFKDKISKSFYGTKKDEKDNEIENTIKTDPKVEPLEGGSKDVKREAVAAPAPSQLMWVDKYRPQSVKQIIGQHGDASNVKKLMNWLSKWYINRKQKLSKPSPWAKSDDGAYFRAALLSGPPGVGKTTTVTLVCKELGFDTMELNASDSRSKSLVQQQVGELLSTNSLAGYAKGATNKSALTKKHVLVMDEVDGMAGNEDRGGLQELISLIKTSSVPVVCMCNERNSDKMRTLANYCYDLKFAKPRVDQIKSAMLSICCKERVRVPAEALTRLIASCNQDVRQTLTALSVWAAGAAGGAEPGGADADAKRKDLKMGPWDAVRRVFSAEEHRGMSVADRSDLFFHDYSIAPLFVQENYIHVTPHCDKREVLTRLSRAADAISLGDIVESRIRRSQAWSLLPVQAIFSSVLPGAAMAGHVSGQIQFPGWLGRRSRQTKMSRLATELHAHTRLSTTGSKSSIHLDYARALRDAVVHPLVAHKAEGVPAAVAALAAYSLLREDLDSLTELAAWPGQRDPMAMVEAKVKAAMTRAYNKQAPALPHAPPAARRRAREDRGEGLEDDGEDEEEQEEDNEPENDAMIKVKKTTSKSKAASERAAASTSKSDKGKKGKGKK